MLKHTFQNYLINKDFIEILILIQSESLILQKYKNEYDTLILDRCMWIKKQDKILKKRILIYELKDFYLYKNMNMIRTFEFFYLYDISFIKFFRNKIFY